MFIAKLLTKLLIETCCVCVCGSGTSEWRSQKLHPISLLVSGSCCLQYDFSRDLVFCCAHVCKDFLTVTCWESQVVQESHPTLV